MGAAIAGGRAAVGIGHAGEVVGSARRSIDRLERAEHHMDLVPLGRVHKRRGRIERRRHAPRTRIAFGKADELRPLPGGALDRAHGIRDIGLVRSGRMTDGLDDGNAKAHLDLLRLGGCSGATNGSYEFSV